MNEAPISERRPPGAGRRARVAAADRVADADGAGRRDAERHHEGEAREVERDLVRRERDGVEAAGQRAGGGEHAEFERHLRGGRQRRGATQA